MASEGQSDARRRVSEGQLVTCPAVCRLGSHLYMYTPNNWKRSTLYFYYLCTHAQSNCPSLLSLPPSIQTFFSEGASQQKELAVLRELCEGHFNHDNLCRVLDVSLDRAPVLSWKGALLGTIAASGRDALGACIVKEARCFLPPSPPLTPPLTPPFPHRRGSV